MADVNKSTLSIGNRLIFNHPQFSACACGITSQMFCKSWADKPFSLCLKAEKKDESSD